MNTKHLTELGLLAAVSLILSYLESLLPSPGIPGVKLGLANVTAVFLLYRYGFKEAACVSLLRILLSNLLFGSAAALLYALAGGIMSILLMTGLKKTGRFSAVGVSIAGGVAHNFGQILMAILLLETSALLYYLPILCLSGLFSGALIGLLGGMLEKRLPKEKY